MYTSTQRSPRAYAKLSILAALATIGLKSGAYWITGSVGLLSDAMESGVNLGAALVALWMLTLAALPPDEEHLYGHTKAEYFSSGVEAVMILLAAFLIGFAAFGRLAHPQPLENVYWGLTISVVAAVLNGLVALVLFRAGKRLRSITLTADAHHLMTDVYTTGGVVVAVILVKTTGWLTLDPLIAIAVACNILFMGFRLLNDSIHGLLDTALPVSDIQAIEGVLNRFREEGVGFHALRTRASGSRRFISVHVLAPGAWTIQEGHDLCERIEHTLRDTLSNSVVFTHLEPAEDPKAWEDQHLDRTPQSAE